MQAIAATGSLSAEFSGCLRLAHQYLERSQVVEEAQAPLGEYYRHISKGAWPFSTRDHGWPISDCSSEGLKAALILAKVRCWWWRWCGAVVVGNGGGGVGGAQSNACLCPSSWLLCMGRGSRLGG